MPPADSGVRVVLTMAPDREVGAIIARKLIEDHLAACVNVIPGAHSFYRWRGRVQEDSEALMIIKTTQERCSALAARIDELHPYDLPEVLVLPSQGGSESYLDWVMMETKR